MAWRTGTWADQPCRRISFPVPLIASPTWNSRPISVLIRPSVHRWLAANPFASYPSAAELSRAPFSVLSRSCDTGPLDRSASAPPSRQARRHRRTEPSVNPQVVPDLADRVAGRTVRRHPATAVPPLLPAAIYPPVHTACPGHSPTTARRHDPTTTSSPWLASAYVINLAGGLTANCADPP